MSDIQEPNWIDVSHLGNMEYEEQIDVNSRVGAMRHRRRSFSGECFYDWMTGPAPEPSDQNLTKGQPKDSN
jgi:hypothetical protein